MAQRHVRAAHDPYHLAHRLRRTPVYLSCGNGEPGPLDPPGTERDWSEELNLRLNRATAGRLAATGTPPATHFHAGTHHPAYGARELRSSLPLLLDALEA